MSNDYVDLTADNIGEYFAEGDELLKLGSFREIATKRANRKTSKGKRKVRVGTVNKVRRDFTQAIHKTLKNHFNIELLKPLYQQLGKELYKDPQIAAGIILIKRASVHILMDAGVPNVNEQKIESDVKENLRCLLKPRSQKRQRPGNILCSF